ncbi:MAG: glycosyltransferase [Fretibacterium sp.]|nr:glycosyltransferase [Fretibacterium sp.]
MSLSWDVSQKVSVLEQIEDHRTSGDEQIIPVVLEKFYTPLKTELKKQCEANLKLLKNYPYCYADDATLPEVLPVWMDEQEIIYFLPSEKRFNRLQRLNLDRKTLTRNTPIAVPAQFWTEDLTDYEQYTSLTPESHFLDMDIPMYLLYTAEEWAVFLQVADVKPLLAPKRVVFIAGSDNIKNYFQDDGVIFPKKIYGTDHVEEYDTAFHEIYDRKLQYLETDLQNIKAYYSDNEAEIDRHFSEGRPRIMSVTTRFSTAIQFHTRDSMDAVQRLGGESVVLIEKDPLHRVDPFWEAKTVAEFKPDAIFLISHFRDEHNSQIYPKGMVSIGWNQDNLPHIMDPITPTRLHKRDFIMEHLGGWKPFWEVGYDREQIIDAPIPANPYIYRPYELTLEERERYGSDICFVCHAVDIDGYIKEICNNFEEPAKPYITEMYKEYYRMASKGYFLYGAESFKKYIDEFMRRRCHINISSPIRDMIAEKHMSTFYNRAVGARVFADWLIAAGLKNIKLWGNGWLNCEKYHPYAMGPAQNGETLSKIYQASKIVMGNNIINSGAARAWESMLSGAFFMSPYIPPEEDWEDIRKVMKVGEDLVMFYNKKDLIKKVRYYLKHDEERREMARRGREVALQKMTYDAMMKRVITFIGDKLKARGAEQGL